MPSWQFKNLDDATKLVSTEPIGSSSAALKPIELEVAPGLSFPATGVAVGIAPRGVVTVAALNGVGHDDQDGIVMADDAEAAEGTLPPHLRVGDRAWLKLRAEAGVTVTGEASVTGSLGLDGSGSTGVVFADYRVHPVDTPMRQAFLEAIRQGRFVTRLEDVESLGPNEALALRRTGTIQAAVTLRLADIFAGPIGTLASQFGTTGPVALSFEAGAAISARVTVSDEFVIAISRAAAGTWRAGIRKARTREVAPSVEAGITVGFDEDRVEQLLTGAVDGVLGAPLARVKPLLEKASLQDLNDAERRLAMFLIERLHLDPLVTGLDTLRARIEALEETVATRITELARARIALSFAYEYSRLDEHVNLLQVTLDRAALTKFQPAIVRGHTAGLVDDLRAHAPGIALESYLNQKSVTSEHSWGFSLGLGKWLELGGRDFKTLRRVQRVDLSGTKVQESYLGARGYRGTWVGETFEWAVDLAADMRSYETAPRVSDFAFGLHLSWLATQTSLSAGELEDWLDTARIWGVADEASLPDIRGRMAKALDRDARVEVHMTIPDAVFRSLLPRLGALTPDDYAGPLATAMPWMARSPARTDPALRRALYEPLWRGVLAQPSLASESLTRMAVEHLRREGRTELLAVESFSQNMPDPMSFAGLARINGHVRAHCGSFSRGAALLAAAIARGEPNQRTIESAAALMSDLWEQSHFVRAAGALFLDLARSGGVAAGLSRSMTIQAKGLSEALVVAA